MTIKELTYELRQYGDDTEVALIVWDGNDKYDAELSINEYDSGVDVEFVLEEKYEINVVGEAEEKYYFAYEEEGKGWKITYHQYKDINEFFEVNQFNRDTTNVKRIEK